MASLTPQAGEKSKSAHEAPSAATASSSSEPPPTYEDAPPCYVAAQRALSSLAVGPPDETISVPMVTRSQRFSIHNYNPFSHKHGDVRHFIVTRQMKRSHYLAHYVKDAEGNYVGTGPPAPDAETVFVPSKASDEELLRQAETVALKVQRLRGDGIGDWGKPVHDQIGGGFAGGGGGGT